MVIHEQRSDHARTWFDADVVDNGDGALTIPAASFWLHGEEHELAEYRPVVGTGPFRVFVEKAGASADYLLDLTGEAGAVSFGAGIGAPLVAWRDQAGGEIHVLRSVPDAA